MNPDTLRKAVELADGFSYDSERHEFWLDDVDSGAIGVDANNPDPWFVDALAAQLVRQVDALNPKDQFDRFDEGFIVECTRIDCGVFEVGVVQHGFAEGGSRSENTITAITESGVLEFERVR